MTTDTITISRRNGQCQSSAFGIVASASTVADSRLVLAQLVKSTYCGMQVMRSDDWRKLAIR